MTDELAKNVRANIYLGELDDHLDDLIDVIHERMEKLEEELFQDLVPGSLVRFNNNTRPKYLRGVPATVIERKVKNVVVKIGQDIGRFSKDSQITTSVRILDLIEPPSIDD